MWQFIPNRALADVTYMFLSFFFLKNNQKNFRPSIIKVFGRFYFFFLFFGLFLFLVFSFVLDLPKVRTSRKKVFLSKFGPNLLQVDEQSTSFLSLMPKVKRSQRCQKRTPIIASVYETKACFFFHGEIERGTILSF